MGFAAMLGLGRKKTKRKGSSYGTSVVDRDVNRKRGLDSSRFNRSTSFRQVNREEAAQYMRDILGSADGLAAIFGAEQNAGLYNSSVSAQAAGDLASKLVGELAKLSAMTINNSFEQGNERESELEELDASEIQTNRTKGKVATNTFTFSGGYE